MSHSTPHDGGDDFFFFQAEDGIRDLYVTGVQTCALPISARPGDLPRRTRWRAHGAQRIGLIGFSAGGHLAGLAALAPGAAPRSEERRVGKEWRAWWSSCDHVREDSVEVQRCTQVGSHIIL